MPTISTPSKIAGTQAYTRHVYFCGSTAAEREARVAELIQETGAILVPPYDHPDIMIGQGTAALEMDEQYRELVNQHPNNKQGNETQGRYMDAVVSPLGGGGLTGGASIWFSDKPTLVFGAEPAYQGANDAERGLNADPPKRIETVKTLTIADGLRTPVGHHPWKLFTSTTPASAGASGKKYLEQVYSATEAQIASAMRLIMERMKLFIEPSAAVPLAVILYNDKFRQWVADEQRKRGDQSWDVGVILSGGNTTVEAIMGIFGKEDDKKREEGKVGMDGTAVAENVAG
jgi:threonine dehydratase